LKKLLATLLGLFGATRIDSAQGELCPLVPLVAPLHALSTMKRYRWTHLSHTLFVIFGKMQMSIFVFIQCKECYILQAFGLTRAVCYESFTRIYCIGSPNAI